jgi:hypothetical protein
MLMWLQLRHKSRDKNLPFKDSGLAQCNAILLPLLPEYKSVTPSDSHGEQVATDLAMRQLS